MTEALHHFLMCQENALRRLCLVRIFLGIVVFVLLAFGPYTEFYVKSASILYHPSTCWSAFIPGMGEAFLIIKWIALGASVCVALGLFCPYSTGILAISFGLINCYISNFSTDYWINNSHLNFFLIALVFCRADAHYSIRLHNSNKREIPEDDSAVKYASMALAFMIAYVAVLYLQSGVSKILHGGLEWFTTGQTLYVHTLMTGTPIGHYLTKYPILFQAMTLFTAMFELGSFPFFISTRYAKWAAAAAIMFHVGTCLVMGITFWFLWALYPPLFFMLSGNPIAVSGKNYESCVR